ncbi:ATP-binding protein [Hyalangium versicolor]|uniref:ATP-binding protein n=1 Tax=Hyalangium versicolor TaxID=2861190 RepID=UPI001CC9963D|nr:ATP-binding protein [Hyalangium versicolor]
MSSPLPPPSASLARATLLKMGVRVAIVIALATFVSYLHILGTLRDEALQKLETHVSERSQREETIFLLAQDDHVQLKKALERSLQTWSQQDPNPRFDSLFVRGPDGAVRPRRESFDGTQMVGVFIPHGVPDSLSLRRHLLAAYDVAAQYGPAFEGRFLNTYIVLAEGATVFWWPQHPQWAFEAPPDYPILDGEYYTIALPAQNPERRTAWTGVYRELTTQSWMVTASTPLDMDGSQVATLHHDVLLDELMKRSIHDHLPSAYNLLVRDDGQLIAHPDLNVENASVAYNILGNTGSPEEGAPARLASEEQKTHLRALFEQLKRRKPGQSVLELPGSDEYLAVAKLRGPDWTFVTVLPQSVVSSAAFGTARYVLLFGLASLLLELAIMYWVLRQEISRPLQDFTQATHRVAAGDYQVRLNTLRRDELGQLAGAFQAMSDKVQEREEDLRTTNEHLEHRVDERSRELKQVHEQLVQTARQAGMAEIATNVLHNVGNVLNSVYTAAQLAKERLDRMRLDHVTRVATLLQERQGDLATFLTQEERGRMVPTFLGKLGRSLLEDREELRLLLDDVGRYTEHIGDIVKVQQTHARPPRLDEAVSMEALVEDALRINAAALARHEVKLERQISTLPPVVTDKHKVLMILVNLISNAKYAMDGVPVAQRRLFVGLDQQEPDRVSITVRDNGAGIPQEMLTRIFQYGFTTRKEGHGFGLHSSALAAQQLGGTLTGQSDGPGQGATFTLELPRDSTQRVKSA